MTQATQAAIAQTKAEFLTHCQRGDIATAAQVFTPDARSFPPGFPQVDGQTALATFWVETTAKFEVTNIELATSRLEDHGNTIFEEGHYVLSQVTGVLDNGQYLIAWRQQPDGTWRWHRDIWTSSQSKSEPNQVRRFGWLQAKR
mgnify:CR=1 FL=1